MNCGKVFFTFHLPYLTCYKLDFRYNGVEDCNDFSSASRCVKCIIASKLQFRNNDSFSIRNLFIQALTPLAERTGKINSLRERIDQQHVDLANLIDSCDTIFVYAEWFKKILSDNGYTTPKIVKIPYVTNAGGQNHAPNEASLAVKNKILFVGRIEQQKGLLVLCKAMKLIKNPIELDVYGNVVDEGYHEKCKREYDFNFKGTLPLNQLLKQLDQYDFLMMPSVFTEMNSMMIKDAFNYHLPVIASAAKGNKDMVEEGKNGFIFGYDDSDDLARVFDKAYALKERGWNAEFKESAASDIEWNNILSYYFCNKNVLY